MMQEIYNTGIYCRLSQDDGIQGDSSSIQTQKMILEKINLVITKDLSRLGRDYIMTGYYTELFFPDRNVRYIALSDNIDTSKNDNDIAPFKNILNDIYIRDLSRKHPCVTEQCKGCLLAVTLLMAIRKILTIKINLLLMMKPQK